MTFEKFWEVVKNAAREEVLVDIEQSSKREAELELERAANREARELRDKHVQHAQACCDHIQGMDGYTLGSLASTIQWHRYNTAAGVLGPPIGLCKKCGRQFLPTDSDYGRYHPADHGYKRRVLSTAGVPFVPTAQELEERRAWEKTCREFRASQASLGLDEFDLSLEEPADIFFVPMTGRWVPDPISDEDREAIDAILKET